MDQREQIEAIIDLLHRVRSRKSMFIHPVEGTSCQNYVVGVWTGMFAVGIGANHRERWWQAQVARGWHRSSFGPLSQMKKKGMSDEEMAEEVLLIEIDTWQLLLSELPA